MQPYEYPGIADLPESCFGNRYSYISTGTDHLGPLYCTLVYTGWTKSLQSLGYFIHLLIHSSHQWVAHDVTLSIVW